MQIEEEKKTNIKTTCNNICNNTFCSNTTEQVKGN